MPADFKHVALFLAYGTAGALLVALAGLIWLGTAGKPDLKPWHTVALREEFTRADAGRVRTSTSIGSSKTACSRSCAATSTTGSTRRTGMR